MIVHFNSNGSLIEQVSEYTLSDGTQSFNASAGNYSANSIYAIIDGLDSVLPSTQDLTITYKEPNGAKYSPYDISYNAGSLLSINYDAKRDMRTLSFGKKYRMFRFDFPDGLLAEGGDGVYNATIRFVDADSGSIKAYGLITFSVKGGVAQSDSYITESNFDYLLTKVSLSNVIVDAYASYSVSSTGALTSITLYEDEGKTSVIDPTAEENLGKAFLDISSNNSIHYLFATTGSSWFAVGGTHLKIGTISGTAYDGARGLALENSAVTITGSQTISGTKTFTGYVKIGGSSGYTLFDGEGNFKHYDGTNTVSVTLNASASGKLLTEGSAGEANGYAPLNGSAKIDAQYLPSYVDDVLNCYAVYTISDTNVLSDITLYEDADHTVAIDPTDSENEGKIFLDVTEGNPGYEFRTTGTAWALIGGTPLILGEVAGTAYDGAKGAKNASDIATLSSDLNTLAGKVVTIADNQTITGDKAFGGVISFGTTGYSIQPIGVAYFKEMDCDGGNVTNVDTSSETSLVNYGFLKDALPQMTDISED